MAIDFKDCITFKGKDGNTRIAIPRASILSVRTKSERDYGGGTAKDIEITQLFVAVDTARLLGVDLGHAHINDVGVFIPVGDKYEIVLGILRGDKAVEVLF